MGATTSVIGHHSSHISLPMAVKLVLPLYYTDEQVSEEDLEIARGTWNLVLQNKTPAFLAAKEDPSFTEETCLEWFFTMFYDRLFDVHPVCRGMFKNEPRQQGRAMVNLISFLTQAHNDPAKVHQILVDLAHRHVHQHGVKAHEYTIFGEVLIYTLSVCVGKDIFTESVVKIWTKIYCMIITVIVPFHVKHEFETFSAAREAAKKHPDKQTENPTKSGDTVSVSAADAANAVVGVAVA